MKKRFLLTLLAIALVLSTVVVTVSAATKTVNVTVVTPKITLEGEANEVIKVGVAKTNFDHPLGAKMQQFNLPEGKEVTSKVSATVKGTTITFNGVEAKMVIGYKLSTASSYTNKTLAAGDIVDGSFALALEPATYDITIKYPFNSAVTEFTESDASNTYNYKYNYTVSDAVSVTIKALGTKDEPWATPEGFTVEAGAVKGLTAGVSYEIAKVDVATGTKADWTAYEGAKLGAGVYELRAAANNNDGEYIYLQPSAAVKFFVKGDNSGTLTLYNAGSATLTPGMWTVVSPLGNLKFTPIYQNYGGIHGQISVETAAQKSFVAGEYTYLFAEDELIEAKDFFGFHFSKNNNMGDVVVSNSTDENADIFTVDVKGAVKVFVYGGKADVYTVPFTWTTRTSNKFDVDFSTVFEEAGETDGIIYKLAVDFFDFGETSITNEFDLLAALEANGLRLTKIGETTSGDGGKYTYQHLNFTLLNGSSDSTEANRIVLNSKVAEKTPVLTWEGTATAGEYLVSGFDPEKVHILTVNGGTPVEIPAGTTEYVVTGNQNAVTTFEIYVAGTDKTYPSETVTKRINGSHVALDVNDITFEAGADAVIVKGFDGSNDVIEYIRVGDAWTNAKTFSGVTEYTGFEAGKEYMLRYAANGNTLCSTAITIYVPYIETAPSADNLEGNKDGSKFVINGLDANKTYIVTKNGAPIDDITGVTSAELEFPGTFTIYAKGVEKTEDTLTSWSFDSAVVEFTVAGAMPAIPVDALVYDAEKATVTGFSALTEGIIEYGIIAPNGIADFSGVASSQTAVIYVDAGNEYAFRYAKKDTADGIIVSGPTVKIYAKANASDATLKGTVSYNYEAGNHGFAEGKWTTSIGTIYYDGGNRFAFHWTPSLDTAPQLAWMYKFTADEMFTLAELSKLSIDHMSFANSNPFDSTCAGYVRIYAVASDKPYYDIPIKFAPGDSFTVDVASSWAEEVENDPSFQPTGYVSAIEFHYFSEETIQGVNIAKPAANYPVLKLSGWTKTSGNDLATNRTSKFVTLKAAADMSTVKKINAVPGYGGEVVGLNKEATYQVAIMNKETNTYGIWVKDQETGADVWVEGGWIDIQRGVTTFRDAVIYEPIEKGGYPKDLVVRCFALATDPSFFTSTEDEYIYLTIEENAELNGRETIKTDKLVLPEDVELATTDYTFNINDSRWINRLALENIKHDSPDATITFAAKNYKYTVAVADIDLTLDTAHYFDMKVTFNGESVYDRMYSKMASIADEKELVTGIHFESSTGFFFEKATFSVFVGTEYDGYEVELRSYNDRVNRLRNEESVTVEDGWATFSTFGGDYLILSPAYAADNEN